MLIISAAIHHWFEGSLSKGILGYGLEILTSCLIYDGTTSHVHLCQFYIFDNKGSIKSNCIQFSRPTIQARLRGKSVFYSCVVAIF